MHLRLAISCAALVAAPVLAQSDTAAARAVFSANLDAIHHHDRQRYLSYYLSTEGLIRNGPGGPDLGFAGLASARDTTWPDTLIARDLRVWSLAPGVVYGTYHYRVTQHGVTSEGISERVFVRTANGWKIAVSTAFGLPAGAAPPPLALVGGTLVNPSAAPVSNAAVVFKAGRVVCAGPRASCPVPPGTETIDVRGKFIAPGLIDAHVHYSQTGWIDGRPDAGDVRSQFPYDSTIIALRDHHDRFDRAYLCTGVTAVFDVGGYPWSIELARRQDASLVAPHMAAAGGLLSTIDFWLNLPDQKQFIYMRDDSTVRATVRALARAGSSAIKVWYIQVPDSLAAHARAMLEAAGDESRRVGLPLIVHATQLARAKEAVAAGARVLVHGVEDAPVDSAFLALAKQKGVIDIPTITVLNGYADVWAGRSPGERYPLDCVDPVTRAHVESVAPAPIRANRAAAFERVAKTRRMIEANVRAMMAAGIPIAMGTDAGNPGTVHGPSVYAEMEAMQHAGMPAAAVFSAATEVSARAMGRQTDLGSLAPGKIADAVVFDADPAADAVNMRSVRWVVRGGAIYGRSELLPARSR